MVELLRHRQTKGAATDMFYLTPPRHISTLPNCDMSAQMGDVCFTPDTGSDGPHQRCRRSILKRKKLRRTRFPEPARAEHDYKILWY
jgi:hypothetical protein